MATKPSPGPQRVTLPDGNEIVPEHFHEGAEATRMFQRGLRSVLNVSREELKKRQEAWKQLQAKRRKRR